MTTTTDGGAILTINNAPIINGEATKKKKKTGVFGFFKAAMFAVRHRKQKVAGVNNGGDMNNWTKLVGSMRPLHLHQEEPALTCASTPVVLSSTSSGTMSQYGSVDDLQALDDNASTGTMSQYASANDLQALDQNMTSAKDLQALDEEDEDEEDPDRAFDAIGADDLIDAKAEEFIFQFYQQMRRQNIDSINGQFN